MIENPPTPPAPLDGIKVIMDPHMPRGTMVVSRDVFEQLSEIFPKKTEGTT